MDKIINKEFHVGDNFIGMINGAKFIVNKIGKDNNFYGTESGNAYQNKDVYVTFQDIETGRISETNLKNAQRLLLQKVCF